MAKCYIESCKHVIVLNGKSNKAFENNTANLKQLMLLQSSISGFLKQIEVWYGEI